jgi:hypothetical protein
VFIGGQFSLEREGEYRRRVEEEEKCVAWRS